MHRTQVYLTELERKKLAAVSRRTGQTRSELIRHALDRFLEQQSPAARLEAMRSARGMWKDRNDGFDIEALRKEWSRE